LFFAFHLKPSGVKFTMSEAIRVLLADDHQLFLKGLVGLLKERDEFAVVGEASSGPQAAELASQVKPDVVILDVHMPGGDGLEAIKQIKRTCNAKVLMLTISDKDADLLPAIQAGADGYLLKNLEPDELFSAISLVATGQGVLSPEVTGKVMSAAMIGRPTAQMAELSPRERQVLLLVAQGLTTPQISESLVISDSTVKTHLRHVMEKLDAANRAEAVAKAAAQGLLQHPF
jgi:DNA-binding NarL/FixJ family response regulator